MNDDANRQLRKLTGYPDIISAENIAWARNRARLKDDLRLEVIDWSYILDSHEALRAQLSTLQAALDQAKAENVCDICCGAPLASGRSCACSGTGLMSRAALYLRQQLVKTESELEQATKERDDARKDASFHADCRPNRKQAEAWRDDAKAMNDKWADEFAARKKAEAALAQVQGERDRLKAAIDRHWKGDELSGPPHYHGWPCPHDTEPFTDPYPDDCLCPRPSVVPSAFVPAVSALAALPGEPERTCATCRWVGLMKPLAGKLKCCNQESPADNRIVPADFYCKFYEPSPAARPNTEAPTPMMSGETPRWQREAFAGQPYAEQPTVSDTKAPAACWLCRDEPFGSTQERERCPIHGLQSAPATTEPFVDGATYMARYAKPSLDRPTLERAIEVVNGLLLEVRNQREYGMGYQNAVRDAAFKLEQLRDDAEAVHGDPPPPPSPFPPNRTIREGD